MSAIEGEKKISSKTDRAQQAAAIPYRRKSDQIEFCLVTSTSGRWIFPKGLIKSSETYVETALSEAEEEAGLRGKIFSEPLGYYGIEKDGQRMTVIAVLMKVTQVEKEWKESGWRKRRWLTADKARDFLDGDDLCRLLDVAMELIHSK